MRPGRPSFHDAGEMKDDVWQILKACWSHIAAKRPKAEDLVEKVKQVVAD